MRDASGLALAIGMLALILGLVGVVMPSSPEITWSQPSRVKDTVYHNDAGRPLLIIVDVASYVQSNDLVKYAVALGNIGASDPPTTTIAKSGIQCDELGESTDYGCLAFFVPSDYYYAVYTYVQYGSITLDEWTEIQM